MLLAEWGGGGASDLSDTLMQLRIIMLNLAPSPDHPDRQPPAGEAD